MAKGFLIVFYFVVFMKKKKQTWFLFASWVKGKKLYIFIYIFV